MMKIVHDKYPITHFQKRVRLWGKQKADLLVVGLNTARLA